MIPQEKTAAVNRALHEAFGVTEINDIRQMTRGHTSALVLRIIVRGVPYLMRIITQTNTFLGPGRHYSCMTAAAEAGLAPRVWYTNVEDGIAITDFVEEVPLPRVEALVRLPRVLRALHALPPFPGTPDHLNTTCTFLLNKGSALDMVIQKFQAADVFSKSECEEVLGWHAQIAAAYRQQEDDMVSSHNDLFKPDNILFDGDRVWLVDWEAAFRNDRYADLAAVANLVITNDDEETTYLKEYFETTPNVRQLARFYVMRQLVHIFYVMAFSLRWPAAARSTDAPVNRPNPAIGFHEFHQRMWAGEVDLADSETRPIYARVHWEQLLRNMQDERFQQAVRILTY